MEDLAGGGDKERWPWSETWRAVGAAPDHHSHSPRVKVHLKLRLFVDDITAFMNGEEQGVGGDGG